MRIWQDARARRWALLAWLGILYVLSLLSLDFATSRPPQPAFSAYLTLLLVLHIGLYRYGHRLLEAPARGPFVLYLGAQSGLLVLMSRLVTHNVNLPLGLTLALMAEAIITLPPWRRALAVAWYDILCCLVIVAIHLGDVVQNIALLLLGVLPILLCMFGYVTLYQRQLAARERTQALLRELEVAHAELAAYADRVEDLTLLTERQRMARELHDTLAQGLAGVILQLEAARLRLAGGETERAGEIIDQARDRARTALASARQAIDDLRGTPAGAVDTRATVEAEIRRFSTATGAVVEAEVAALETLPAHLAEQATRLITDGLTNVLRHARAHRVWVHVTSGESEVETMVRDDGVGFDVTAVAAQPGHYGLLGLRERARLAGGELEVKSGPGQGTTLRLTLPRTDTAARPGSAAVALQGSNT